MPIARSLLLVFVFAAPAAASDPEADGKGADAPQSTLGFDGRLGLLLPPALWAAGVSLRPVNGVSFSAYGMAGPWVWDCDGCYLAGAEIMGRPRDPAGDGGYLTLGAAFAHLAPDDELLLVPVTGGYLWALDGIDVRTGGGLFVLESVKEPECTGLCLDFTPLVLPYVEVVVSVWAL